MEVSYPDVKTIYAFFMIIFMDFLWFYISKDRVYPKFENIKIVYALIAWIALALTVGTSRPTSVEEAGIFGLSTGAIIFGVFNGSEAALRPDWRTPVTIVSDTLWGSILMMLVSIASFIIDSALSQ